MHPIIRYVYIVMNIFILGQTCEDLQEPFFIIGVQLANLHAYLDNIDWGTAFKFKGLAILIMFSLIMFLATFLLTRLLNLLRSITMNDLVKRKLQSQRYKRICDTVQQGILILKGNKIKFFNGIFQNLAKYNLN